MNKYVAYYRVSKDSHEAGRSKAKGLGLEAQNNICHHYHGEQIVKEFTETKSAKNITDRPVLQEAIRYCLENNCHLLLAKLDRLSRNTMDVLTILKALNKRISFCDIPGEADEFIITIFAAIATREREIIALRTSQALQVKIKREGKYLEKNPKWLKQQEDWIQSGSLHKLAVSANIKKAADNQNNIRATQLVIAKKAEGLSFGQIAGILNENKFFASEGGEFTRTQVRRIYKRAIEKNKIAA